MAKHRKRDKQPELRNPERSKFNQELNTIDSYEEAEERWNQGEFLSLWGDNNQGMVDHQTKSPKYDWGESFRECCYIRKTMNAKAKKPKNKKYYKKTKRPSRGKDHRKIHQEPDLFLQEHVEWVEYRGGYYADCKSCELPMHHGAMHNYDFAICWGCVEAINIKESHFEALF